MPWSTRSAQGLGQTFDLHIAGVTLGIHFRRTRRKNHIHTSGSGQFAVMLQIARVILEILPLAELSRVDENRQNQQVAAFASFLQQ